MAGREGPPAVVQAVVVGLGADVDGDEGVVRGCGEREAAREEVGARAADRVLDQVGEDDGEGEGDGEAEEGNVVGVGGCADGGVVGGEEEDGEEDHVEEVEAWVGGRLVGRRGREGREGGTD